MCFSVDQVSRRRVRAGLKIDNGAAICNPLGVTPRCCVGQGSWVSEAMLHPGVFPIVGNDEIRCIEEIELF